MAPIHSVISYVLTLITTTHAISIPSAIQNQLITTGIPDSQNVSAPSFIGTPSAQNPLPPKPIFVPDVRQAHIDGGNTRTNDYMGPLGNSPQVFGANTPAAYLFWEDDGDSSYVLASLLCGTESLAFCLTALDPDTLEPLAQWSSLNRTAMSNYWQIRDGRVLVPTLQGVIVLVEAVPSDNGTVSFHTIQEWDVSRSLKPGSLLITVGFDGDDNLWFTTTSTPSLGIPGTNGSTIGYIRAGGDGTMHTLPLENAIMENSMAINGRTAYIVTGPAGEEDRSDAVGHFYAVQAGINGGVHIVYNESYSAGSELKPGGLSRGSGSSVGLLGQKYVAITDNADQHINLLVYRQAEEVLGEGESELVCSYPLFAPNASANEASLTTYFDGETYSAMISNCYNSPFSLEEASELNGPQNDFSGMAAGVTRIDVSEDGVCSFVWDLPVRATQMTTLSTESGLFYVYTQDEDLASRGEYVWYIAAYDFRTGKEAWRARLGSGGAYHPGVSHIQLGPNGRIYQGVNGGMAWMQDA